MNKLIDKVLQYAWGPLAVALAAVVTFLLVALAVKLLVGVGIADMVANMPDPVKVMLIGVTALGAAVAAFLRGYK